MLVETVGAEIVDAAGRCRSTDELGLVMLQQLRRVAPCDSALFLPSSSDEAAVALDRKPLFVGHYRQNQERYRSELAPAHDFGLIHGAYIDNEIFSLRDRQKLAFFSEIIQPQKIAGRLIVQLKFRGRASATIHLCSEGHSRIERRALDNVRLLAPLLSLAYAAAQVYRPPESGQLGELTRHQHRVAVCVARGYSNKEIAALLQISPYTVRNELVAIFRKAGVVNRSQLAALVMRPRSRS